MRTRDSLVRRCAGVWLTAVVMLTGGAATAETWVVGPAGQPGIDFSDPNLAAAAAVWGDTIVMRAGTYPTLVLPNSKALTFVGAGNDVTTLQGVAIGGQSPLVSNIVIRGVKIVGYVTQSASGTLLNQPAITLTNVYYDFFGYSHFVVSQAILFEDCEISSQSNAVAVEAQYGFGLRFVRCSIRGSASLEMSSGTLISTSGGHGVRLNHSDASFHECEVFGGSPVPGYSSFSGNGGAGLVLTASGAAAFASEVRGGDAGPGLFGDGDGTGMPGIAVVVTGNSMFDHQASEFQSGVDVPPGFSSSPEPIYAFNGNPVIEFPGVAALLRTPGRVTIGQSFAIELEGPTAAHAFLLAGIQIASNHVPGYLGQLYLAPPLPIVLDLGGIPVAGKLSLPVTAPLLAPGVESVSFVLQGVVIPVSEISEFSNPSSLTVVIPGL